MRRVSSCVWRGEDVAAWATGVAEFAYGPTAIGGAGWATAPAKVHRAADMATRPEDATGRAKVHCGQDVATPCLVKGPLKIRFTGHPSMESGIAEPAFDWLASRWMASTKFP